MSETAEQWELERWLAKPGRTQQELADQVDVSQGAVSQWLRKRRVPHRRVRVVERVTKIPASRLNPDFAR